MRDTVKCGQRALWRGPCCRFLVMSLFPSPTLLAPAWRVLRTAVRIVGSVVLLAWSLILVAWLVLHWAILPRIEDWRPQIERAATRALGAPVQIGRIRVESHGWVPTLELADVVLRDPQGRESLRLERAVAAVSAASALQFQLRFRQLLIDRPTLDVRRDAQGRILVAGLDLAPAPGDDSSSAASDWFFSQSEFVIRDGRLRWVDDLRQAPALELTGVDLIVRNGSLLGSRRHDWRLDATPPADWGERFTLRGRFHHPLLGSPGDVSRWTGQAYAELPHADVRRLREHVDLPFELSQGQGALRLWADVQSGRVVGATADTALTAVNLRLSPQLQPLALASVRGRVSGQHHAKGYRFSVEGLSFQADVDAGAAAATAAAPADAQVPAAAPRTLDWPASRLSLSWQQLPDQPVTGGELAADTLDLAILAQLAERLPLGAPVRHLLAELSPQGQVHGLQLGWQGPPDAPTGYRAEGRIDGLALASARSDGHPARPGVRGASLSFSATHQGGHAQLAITDGALSFPGVFDDPDIALQRLQARLDWTLDRPRHTPITELAGVALRVTETHFANADAEGTLAATWRTGAGAGVGSGARLPGWLDLQGRLTRADATRTWRYLPTGIPAHVRDYVRRAVMVGSSSGVDFLVKGDLWDFPFGGSANGQFRIASKIENASFAYVPGEDGQPSPWPAFTQVRGDLIFDRTAMLIRNARARLFGFELQDVQGGIADLAHDSVLSLEGAGAGPLADALRFVNATPLGLWTGQALAGATGTGDARLKLAVNIPLSHVDQARVQGTVTLQGNDVQITPDTPLLAQARGQVEFSNQGFTVRGGRARVLGGEASFEGGTQKDGQLLFTGQGVATAEGLRRAAEWPALPYLAEQLQGQAAYRLQLGLVRGHTELSLTSSLAGMTVNLPAPLDKAVAASPLPLKVDLVLDRATLAAGQVPRDRLTIDLGGVARAQYLRELRPDGARVVRGGIGLGTAPPQPVGGVTLAIDQPLIDVDAWQAAAQSFQMAPGLGSGASAQGGYAPTAVSLKARELRHEGRTLTALKVEASEQAGQWRAQAEADQLQGYVEYRPGAAGAAGRVFARLGRLSLPASEAEPLASTLDDKAPPAPALDVVVDDFELRGLKLGRLEIEASNRLTGEIREWRMSRFNLTMPEARLAASGSWHGVKGSVGAGRPRAVMDFQLDIADSGALLERLGQHGVVRGGKGRMEGQVSWAGSPLSPDFPSMGGQFKIEVHKGQFLKADPGIAKLAGILSLQSLPRRLVLDFRDVFQEGFAFDVFAGDVRIQRGVAQTNNLRLRGVSAAVLMEGSADIAHETQSLRVVVVPEINAGTASLAYAAINPAVGLGTFLAQMFLRKPMMQAGTREFLVTGPWSEPKVEPVQRKPGDPLPELPDMDPVSLLNRSAPAATP